MIQNFLRRSSAALIAIFCFSIFATAQTSFSNANFSNVKIGNFGQMDERFYRGAQPLESDYQSLKDLGVTTVIDLRNDPMAYAKGAVEALGMKYINISMSGWKTPQQTDVDAFLALVNNPETGKFFVHCKAGIHRTGVVGAAYRYTRYGWNYDQVFKEMKDYNYSNGLVHGKLGSFVKKWGSRIADEKSRAAAATQSTAAVAQGTGN